MIESRQCSDQAGHDRHRVRITTESAQEKMHLLVDHRVTGHLIIEILFLVCVGKLAIEDQIANIHEVAVNGQLLDRIATIEELTLVTINVGDARCT